jgi:mono/diheme cytochrome c family protein
VTEIPEHLLKRSRERRAAVSGDAPAESGAAEQPASTSPAVQSAQAAPAATGPVGRAAATAPAAPPPPPPDPPSVQAAKSRKKIPFWAMAALSLMPIWAFMYARALTDTPDVVEGPLGIGAQVYGNCASCHGGDGGGGVGYQFSAGEVLKTFPHIEDQLRYVYYGTNEYNLAGVEIYGNPDREGGPHIAGNRGVMPQWGSGAGGNLTDAELLAVVCHERYDLGGADPTSTDWADEYNTWCSQDSEIFAGLESGTLALPTLADSVDGILPIGDAPMAGSAPGAG